MKVKEIRTKSGRKVSFYARRRVAGAKPLQKKSVRMWGVFSPFSDHPWDVWKSRINAAIIAKNSGHIVRPVAVSWVEKKV